MHQEAASAGGGGDTDFYVAAVGAPPSSRAAAMHQNSIADSNNARQQLGQGVSMAATQESAATLSMQPQQPSGSGNSSGQSYMSHQR